MNNLDNSSENGIAQFRDRLQERLKIIENQRNGILRKKRKKRFISIFLFLFLPLIFGGSVFVGYYFFRIETKKNTAALNKKIAIKKDRVFRDSIRLLAMELEIQNKQNKSFLDSINQINEHKKDSLFNENNTEIPEIKKTNKKKRYVPKKKTVTYTYTNANDVINFLKSEKENAKIQKENEILKKATNYKDTEKRKNSLINKKPTRFAVFPGCENKTKESKRKKCFDSKIAKHIKKEINKKVFKNSGVNLIKIDYLISVYGNIQTMKVTGVFNETMKNEVLRVMQSLPKVAPALYNVSKVPVKHSVSIKM